MTEYKSHRIVGWVVVNENGDIINRSPSKEELRKLETESRKPFDTKNFKQYTDKELLNYLIQFYKKYGRPPTREDFNNNSGYPGFATYRRRFGTWSAALKLVGLDVESMVKRGIVETSDQKRRFAEIIVRDHFENNPTDLAGENCNSPCDGICPNGKNYDVKSSKLYDEGFYKFGTNNKHKDEIEIYYLLGFNENYTELEYGWRMYGEIVEKNDFKIGSTFRAEFNILNMKQYDVTERLREILVKNGYFEKIENYRKAKEKGLTIYEYDKQLYDDCIVTESDIIKICQDLK